MKRSLCLTFCLCLVALATGLAQPIPAPGRPGQPIGLNSPTEPPALTRFNLDFKGGIPKDLVAAIEKAAGRPLNAIVPDEFADTGLPALKMSNVDVVQLFQALEAASRKREAVTNPNGPFGSYNISETSYGFKAAPSPRVTDDTIWYFYVEKPILPFFPSNPPPKLCRFYALAPYLEQGYTVDDITTAIETGWKMLGKTKPAAISFHKDTKLLIAVGGESELQIISSVLNALDAQKTKVGPAGAPGGVSFQDRLHRIIEGQTVPAPPSPQRPLHPAPPSAPPEQESKPDK